MSLVVFTAVVGLFAAPGELHPWLGFVTILCIALGGGASGALNMWYDADIDAVMKRTAKRPIPSGAIAPGEALGYGLALSAAAVLMLGLFVNVASALLLAFTIFFYVPRGPQAPPRAEHGGRGRGGSLPADDRLDGRHGDD